MIPGIKETKDYNTCIPKPIGTVLIPINSLFINMTYKITVSLKGNFSVIQPTHFLFLTTLCPIPEISISIYSVSLRLLEINLYGTFMSISNLVLVNCILKNVTYFTLLVIIP